MEVDEENDEFEDVKLIEDDVFYLREKMYRADNSMTVHACMPLLYEAQVHF